MQIAVGASTCLEAAAAASDHARAERDMALLAEAADLADRVLPEAERALGASALPPGVGAREEAELHLATARAHRGRIRGRSVSAVWDRLARAWAARPIPYQAAKARWWQTLALLQSSGSREDARHALAEAWAGAAGLPARPLLRALADLAARGRLPLPEGAETLAELVRVPVEPRTLVPVGPGLTVGAVPGSARASDRARRARGEEVSRAIAERLGKPDGSGLALPFGLSPRELDVLLIICEGRTDREIAERLFISERTVHVHVRRVLAKLGVASRTQAASLALRQGLVPSSPAAPSRPDVR
jgi:DNA-binding CsgD family transcriptional regulator